MNTDYQDIKSLKNQISVKICVRIQQSLCLSAHLRRYIKGRLDKVGNRRPAGKMSRKTP